MQNMKTNAVFVSIVIVFTLLFAPFAVAPVSAEWGVKVPVVVELFTSEGCSSCPPADNFLAELVDKQPLSGVEVIPLNFHVDYWDGGDWVDKYSSRDMTVRQKEYALAAGTERFYTPQMIVDGKFEFVGSNKDIAYQAFELVAPAKKATVVVRPRSATGETGLSIGVDIEVSRVPKITKGDKIEVLAAVTEDRVESQVTGGENAGRHLIHVDVVRSLKSLGTLGSFPSKVKRLYTNLAVESGWNKDRLRAVVFLQERKSRRMMGAARCRLEFKTETAQAAPG